MSSTSNEKVGDRPSLEHLGRDAVLSRALVECHADAVITLDPLGAITDLNDRVVRLTQRSRPDLIGAPFRNHFTDPARADAFIESVLAERSVVNCPLTTLAKDGNETELFFTGATFYEDPRRLVGVVVVARNDKERLNEDLRRRIEDLERARLVADHASRAKSEFLARMSHELRSPVGAILGYAQLLDAGKPPPTPSQRGSIGQILRAGRFLTELINKLLDLTVIESGRLALALEPVGLSEVLRECQAMMELQASHRDVTMHFPADCRATFVLVDRVRVKQIVINLLANSIKYNRVGGTVTVDWTVTAADSVRVSVRDSGQGLSPEQLEQLFQPFNRLGQAGSTEEGVGIGLVVSKLLVEHLGGTLGAESTPGKGSRFWFDLRLVPQPLLAAEVLAGDLPRDEALQTLLYIAGNAANVRVLEQHLAGRRNLRLLTADTGKRGVELARKHKPDVILMDIDLPGVRGFDGLRILRLDASMAHIPVLAISVNGQIDDVKSAMQEGFFSYLIKPIDVADLMRSIHLALEHSSSTRPDAPGVAT